VRFTFGLRHSVVETRRGYGNVVDAFALLGQETRVDAHLVEGSISSHITLRP